MSEAVVIKEKWYRQIYWFALFLCLFNWMLPLSSSGADHPAFLVGYTQIRKPTQLVPQSGVTLPSEFTKYPFSLYHVFNGGAQDQLEPVLAVPGDAASVWRSLAKDQAWEVVETETVQLYFKNGSTLVEEKEIQNQIVDHLRYAPASVASGGLMGDWKAFLDYLHNSADLKNAFLVAVFPFLEDREETLGDYRDWLLEEFSNVNSLVWEIDPEQESGAFAVSVSARPGSRLYKLFNRDEGELSGMFGFVPKKPDLQLGRVDGITANNYLNYFFKGTSTVGDDSFLRIRNKLNKIDPGIFDRWDGSWAHWEAGTGGERLLLLGGRFQATDLTEIFEGLSDLPVDGLPFFIELDRKNSVVGFTRVRSFEWMDLDEQTLIGTLIPKPIYFGISNGFAAISESDTALMELVFTLNSRRPLKESAADLFDDKRYESILEYEDGEIMRSVTLTRGRLVLRQGKAPDWFYDYFQSLIKNLAD